MTRCLPVLSRRRQLMASPLTSASFTCQVAVIGGFGFGVLHLPAPLLSLSSAPALCRSCSPVRCCSPVGHPRCLSTVFCGRVCALECVCVRVCEVLRCGCEVWVRGVEVWVRGIEVLRCGCEVLRCWSRRASHRGLGFQPSLPLNPPTNLAILYIRTSRRQSKAWRSSFHTRTCPTPSPEYTLVRAASMTMELMCDWWPVTTLRMMAERSCPTCPARCIPSLGFRV